MKTIFTITTMKLSYYKKRKMKHKQFNNKRLVPPPLKTKTINVELKNIGKMKPPKIILDDDDPLNCMIKLEEVIKNCNNGINIFYHENSDGNGTNVYRISDENKRFDCGGFPTGLTLSDTIEEAYRQYVLERKNE